MTNSFQLIQDIMTDKQFEMMYPYKDVVRLREALVEVHENKEEVQCTEEHYEHYKSACALFGVTPHPRAD